jgi:hypothetical protein
MKFNIEIRWNGVECFKGTATASITADILPVMIRKEFVNYDKLDNREGNEIPKLATLWYAREHSSWCGKASDETGSISWTVWKVEE